MAPMYPPEGTRFPGIFTEPTDRGSFGMMFNELKGRKNEMSSIVFRTPFGSVNLTPDVKGITLEEVTKTVEQKYNEGHRIDAMRYGLGVSDPEMDFMWYAMMTSPKVASDVWRMKKKEQSYHAWKDMLTPKQIIFNGVTTVCIFGDGTKIIARPQDGERFDKETGVAMCIAKYLFGSRSKFLDAVKRAHDQTHGE
jgi:hypothetical protein